MGIDRGRILRAAVSGLVIFFTGIAVYEVPPDAAHLWQPFIQGMLGFLTSLGLTAAGSVVKKSETPPVS